MTWTKRSYPQIQVKSSARDPCGGNLYGLHHCHMPTHWQYWPGKTKRHQQWTKWLASSGSMKKISLPPYWPVSAVEKLSEKSKNLLEKLFQ